MTILLSMMILVAVVAVAVTAFAVLGAKDGYEDESGFHLTEEVTVVNPRVTEEPGLRRGASARFHAPLPSAWGHS